MSTIEPVIAKMVKGLASTQTSWEEVAVVWAIDPKGRANNSWGCSFPAVPDEPEVFSIPPWEIDEELKPYLDDLYPDSNYPIRVLVQFNRGSGRYNVEFEDTNPKRWKISPADWEQAREALRPNLG